MMAKPDNQEIDWGAVIGRALCFLCLHEGGVKDDDLTSQAKFLKRFGLPKEEVARVLGTTADSVRVTLARAAKKGKKRARKPKSQ